MDFPLRHEEGAWVGELGRELTFEALDCLAVALAEDVRRNAPGRRSAIVAHDARFQSDALAERLAQRLQREGFAVATQLNPGPAAALSCAVRSRRAAMGLYVGGGSARAQLNGVAVRDETGAPLGTKRLDRVVERLEELARGRRGFPLANGNGASNGHAHGHQLAPAIPRVDFLAPYFEELARFIDFAALRALPPTRIAVDAMHGTAGRLMTRLLAGTPVEVVEVRGRRDALFGGTTPDPSQRENLAPLRKAIAERRCSWGVAFNGDASRLAVADSAGEAIPFALLLAAAGEHLVRHRGAPGDLMRSSSADPILDRVAASLGRRCLEAPGAGTRSLILSGRAAGAMLAGDSNGAVVFARHAPESDPILFVLLLLEIAATTGLTPEGLAGDLERRFWPARCARREVPGRAEFLRERFQALQDDPPRRVGDVDVHSVAGGEAIRFRLKDGSWLAMRLERGGALACLEGGGQTDARAARAVEDGARLLLGAPTGRVLDH